MPSEKKTTKQQAKGANEKKDGSRYLPAAIIIAVAAIAIVLGYAVSTSFGGGGGQQSFQSFQNSFYSAPRVGIFVTYINGTTFSYADGCASMLIQTIIASRAHHRSMNTIDLAIIANSTSCLVPRGALGSTNGTEVIPLSTCLAMSANEPSVFINYSKTNSTAIRSDSLYTSGDALFLSECGIASELG